METYKKACTHNRYMEKREHELKIYLTEEEKQQIKEKAEETGLQLSSYGRMKVLGEMA